jgi:hypothetical protein
MVILTARIRKTLIVGPFLITRISSGVDVMITVFCDFCQFLAKKLVFFSKANVTIKFLEKLAAV